MSPSMFLLSLLLVGGSLAEQFSYGQSDPGVCYKPTAVMCGDAQEGSGDCSAKFGVFDYKHSERTERVYEKLQRYASSYLETSYRYLGMAMHFKAYNKQRDGLSKLYRKLSDETFEKGQEIMKYITKRGGSCKLHLLAPGGTQSKPVKVSEMTSLARALDLHKALATAAHSIHNLVSSDNTRDPEVASYLESNFLHEQASTIRELAGYSTILRKLLDNGNTKANGKNELFGLSVYLFDEYMQKL